MHTDAKLAGKLADSKPTIGFQSLRLARALLGSGTRLTSKPCVVIATSLRVIKNVNQRFVLRRAKR